MSKAKANIKARIVVQRDGKDFLGPGRIELMQRIQQTGSIAEAARDMGLSYRKAMNLVREVNRVGKEEAILTWKGGPSKGGAAISKYGLQIIEHYQQVRNQVQLLLETEQNRF